MDDRAPSGRDQWFWIAIIAAVLVVIAVLWLRSARDRQELVVVPAGEATDWAVEPDGVKVPVTLPTTPMTPAPQQ